MSDVKDFKLFDLELDEPEQTESDKENVNGIYNPVAAQRESEAKQILAWKAYQEAIIKSGELTNEITKGIQAGEKLEDLLLKATKCISLMTGNDLFYELNKKNIKNIYGSYKRN